MSFGKGTVFVLGAGFTKGFYNRAPLLVDEYDVSTLLGPSSSGLLSENARRIVQAELDSRADGKVNLERLMTRLSGGMPYDQWHEADADMPLLLSRIEDLFRKRLDDATSVLSPSSFLLERFASHCVREKTTCITFNYDEVLDRALWKEQPARPQPNGHWNPDRGYGFPCRPSENVLHTELKLNGPTAMQLLKLHGSLNWHATLGHPRPYEVSAIVHHAAWAATDRPSVYLTEAEQYLERRPFIVPPVLTKAGLVEHPILNVLWSRAFDALLVTDYLVFIGYSLPMTDVGGGFLFREAWKGDHAKITVVDYAQTGHKNEKKDALWSSYRDVFSHIQRKQIHVCGAAKWIEANIPVAS
jgi:SIR2-like domain